MVLPPGKHKRVLVYALYLNGDDSGMIQITEPTEAHGPPQKPNHLLLEQYPTPPKNSSSKYVCNALSDLGYSEDRAKNNIELQAKLITYWF